MGNKKRNRLATAAGVIFLACYGLMVLGEGQQTKAPPTAAPAQPSASREKLTPKPPYTSDHGQMLIARQDRARAQAMALVAHYEQMLQQDPQWLKLDQEVKAEEQDLQKWEQTVRSANGWDGAATYDPLTDSWSKPAPAKAAK